MTSRRFLYVFTFVTGAAVLMIELTASRLLAPFFGTSIFVWGNIIGVVLIALSLGYWAGGKIADARPNPRLLFAIVLGAGVLIGVIPIVYRWIILLILQGFSGFNIALLAGSFLSVLFLFGLPLFLLGMASPFTIRVMTDQVGTAGNTAGSIFAFSTLGSIVGTFGSAFYTVPQWGSRETFLLASALLILVSVIGLMPRKAPVALLLLPLLGFLILPGKIKPVKNIIAERESPYQYLEVLDEGDGKRTLRVNDGLGVQSVYNPGQIRTDEGYYDYLALTPYLRPEKRSQSVLLIGLAAGTATRELDELVRKDIDLAITGVEIDPVVIELGRQHFALGQQRITIVNADGRDFLRRSAESYDVILVDAYSQQIYIPYHLATEEFFSLVRERLAPDGILAMNINAVDRSSKLLEAFLATVSEVFPEVYLTHVGEGLNYYLVAAQTPIDFDAFSRRIAQTPYADIGLPFPAEAERIEGSDGLVLTDNRSPVELMTEKMIIALIGRRQLDQLFGETGG